jgi:hypothetical protein
MSERFMDLGVNELLSRDTEEARMPGRAYNFSIYTCYRDVFWGLMTIVENKPSITFGDEDARVQNRIRLAVNDFCKRKNIKNKVQLFEREAVFSNEELMMEFTDVISQIPNLNLNTPPKEG